MTDEEFELHWGSLEDAGNRFGQPERAACIVHPQIVSIPKLRSLVLITGGAVLGPAMGFLMFVAYLDSSLNLQINPSVVVGGLFLIVGIAIYVLKWAADKVFKIIDGYPALVSNVESISADVAEIKEAVKVLPQLRERVVVVETRLKIEPKD